MQNPQIYIGLELPKDFAQTLAGQIASECNKAAQGHRYVGLREASQIMNMTRAKLRALCDTGLLSHYPGAGHDIEFRVSDLWEYKDRQRKEAHQS